MPALEHSGYLELKAHIQLKQRLAAGLEKLEVLPLTQIEEGDRLVEELLPIAENLSDLKAHALILQIYSQLLTQAFQLERAGDAAHRALKLFQRLEDRRGHASCLNTLALIHERENRIGESIGYYEEALNIAQSVDYVPAIGHIANNLGLSYTYFGDYERAIECYRQSLDAWSRAEIAPGKANVLLNLGILYLNTNEYEEAERYFSESLALYQQFDDKLRIITVRYNITQLRLEQGDFPGAREHAQLTLDEAETAQIRDPMRLGHAHEALGRVLGSCGDTVAGREHLLKARSLYNSVQVFRGEANVLEALAAFPDVSDAAAIEMLHEAYEFFREQKFKPRMLKVQLEISQRYKKLHAWEKALNHLENARLLEKEIAAEKSEAQLLALRVSHELARAHQETEMERLRNIELAGALREVEEQRAIAREESRQKSEILSIAAHDMRNLTSNVVSTTAMSLEMWGDNQPLAHEWLRIAHNASAELNSLLEHLIDGAAIDSGVIRFRRERTDLSALVRKVMNTWAGIAGTKEQTLQIDAAVEVESLVDPMRVQQIVHNLVSNAIKYSPKGGIISARVYESDVGRGVVEVTDSGPGFTAEDRRNLFQPFQRLSARPTGDEASSGLGLSIVKRLVDLHQAQIEVDNIEAGGSRFRVSFAVESENGS